MAGLFNGAVYFGFANTDMLYIHTGRELVSMVKNFSLEFIENEMCIKNQRKKKVNKGTNKNPRFWWSSFSLVC